LKNSFPKRSTFAWGLLAAYILIYDVVAIALNDINKSRSSDVRYETFSDGCWRGVEHPFARWPIWLVILILVKHLGAPNFLREYDPIGIVGKVIRYIGKKKTNG
jgi:hypothetical protein